MRGTQVAVMSLIDVVDRLDTDRIRANNHLIMAMISLNDGDTDCARSMIELAMEDLAEYEDGDI